MENCEWLEPQCLLGVESDENDNFEPFEREELTENTLRFELLSAYLDGEVTIEERRQVQQWLDNDPHVRKLYSQLLRLQQNIKKIPAPTKSITNDVLVEQVFQKIDQRKSQKLVLVGGALLIALSMGFVSHLLPGQNSFLQFAKTNDAYSEPLMIALNQPIVEIPVITDEKRRH